VATVVVVSVWLGCGLDSDEGAVDGAGEGSTVDVVVGSGEELGVG